MYAECRRRPQHGGACADEGKRAHLRVVTVIERDNEVATVMFVVARSSREPPKESGSKQALRTA